jgi:hypothetical protein
MQRATVWLLTSMLLLGTSFTAPAAAQGQAPPTGLIIPVVGAVTGTVAGVFNGAARITGFAVQNGQLVATGTLTGTVTNAAGVVVQSVAATFSTPILQQAASCEILNLVLGPIHLDLLGLVVDTNQIVVLITAVPGAGNLLGNLLCAVAGLLDGGGPLSQVTLLLNRLLALL